MSNKKLKPDNIMVRIGGKWGDAKLSLAEWIKEGPSEQYPFQTPGAAWYLFTGDEIPLDVIPHPFLNSIFSIMLVLDELVPDPWNRDHQLLRDDLDMFMGREKEKCEQQYQIIKADFLKKRQQNEREGEENLSDLCWQIANSKQ